MKRREATSALDHTPSITIDAASTTTVLGEAEAPASAALAPVANAGEVAQVRLSDAEKKFIAFLVEQALKPWMPGT